MRISIQTLWMNRFDNLVTILRQKYFVNKMHLKDWQKAEELWKRPFIAIQIFSTQRIDKYATDDINATDVHRKRDLKKNATESFSKLKLQLWTFLTSGTQFFHGKTI